ncbi:MAG: NAD(+)/NADH kinase [Actinomycetota bacterium]|jgi:predicted polyphosphate/ATP-dependent NAD kinase|nr:NAD(+)/NADH kinase [Actinomycetota bacterium]
MGRLVGFLVNPVAGMGGRVGLHGTDTAARAVEARRRGGSPVAPLRSARALRRLASSRGADDVTVLAAPASMGAVVAASSGLRVRLLDVGVGNPTSAADTAAAAAAAAGAGADLLLFAGGDGTAADVLSAVGRSIPLLGIPAGVKMRSGVFAATPEAAGDLAAQHLRRLARVPDGEVLPALLTTAEVVDAHPADRMHGGRSHDADALGERGRRAGEWAGSDQAVQTAQPAVEPGPMANTLIGVALVPRADDGRLVGTKSSTSLQGGTALDTLAEAVAFELDPETLYLVGPGTTTSRVLGALGLEGDVLGVDAVTRGELVGVDLSEDEILGLVDEYPRTGLILGVIGGQGMLLGRGNQQLGPRVLSRLSPDDVTILSSPDKLVALRPALLRVDAGDQASFPWLTGYRRVRVAPRRYMMMRVDAA